MEYFFISKFNITPLKINSSKNGIKTQISKILATPIGSKTGSEILFDNSVVKGNDIQIKINKPKRNILT